MSAGAPHAVLQMASLGRIAEDGPLVIDRASGMTLTASDGREYIDALSGLYNVNVGWGRDELADVAAATMRRLGYASNFFGRTTQEALDLSETLARITPDGIDRFFFTTGGSDAVDTALKLIRHANVLAGQPDKMTVIARRDSYHGMTMGGTTATGVSALREGVGPLLPGVVHIGQPGSYGDGATAADLERTIVELGPENVAAFLGEPVAMPPGLAIPPDDYWPAIREVCTRHDVRLIADEVITGFGRTGHMFASERWSIRPDVMTMAKGITSGYMPLGAVGISEEHYRRLVESDTILPHGFTGRPPGRLRRRAGEHRDHRAGGPRRERRRRRPPPRDAPRRADRLPRHDPALRGVGMLSAFDLDGERVTGARTPRPPPARA